MTDLGLNQVQEAANISGSQVGAIVGMGSSEIGSAAAAYLAEMEESRKLIDLNLQSGKLGQAAGIEIGIYFLKTTINDK